MKTKRTQPLPLRHCKQCSAEFIPSRTDQLYCSSRCRLSHFTERRFSHDLSHLRHVLRELESAGAFPQLQSELQLVISHLEGVSK